MYCTDPGEPWPMPMDGMAVQQWTYLCHKHALALKPRQVRHCWHVSVSLIASEVALILC